MGKKKEFWELADSTILGRTKKVDLLQIARNEHGQIEVYCAQLNVKDEQLNVKDEQIKVQSELIEQLHIQLLAKGELHEEKEKIETLMQAVNEQQRNHEQELSRLQTEAKNWERVAQNYKDVTVTQKTEIARLKSLLQSLNRFAKMTPKEVGLAFVEYLFGRQDKDIDGENSDEDSYAQTIGRNGSKLVSGKDSHQNLTARSKARTR